MRIRLLLCLFLIMEGLCAQPLFNNNGSLITVTGGGVIQVNGSLNNFSAPGFTGQFNNSGTVRVDGDIENNADLSGTGNADFELTGNWVNNSAFTSGNSNVLMDGGNQLITGSSRSVFYNLNLSGGSSVKSLRNVDAEVTGSLSLNNTELAVESNEMLVSNTSLGSIQRNSGYVSTGVGGRLSRSTATLSPYLFPLGTPSATGTSIYRPLEITPNNINADTLGAALFLFPDSSGWLTSELDSALCKVNPNFYHNIYSGSPVDIKMFFSSGDDGYWTDIAQWKSGLWNNTTFATLGYNGTFSTVKINGWSDFTSPVFALASRKFTVDAGPDIHLVPGQTAVLDPLVLGNGISTFSWTPGSGLVCSDCRNPEVSPVSSTQYFVVAQDFNGCSAIDSVWVIVDPAELLLPTAFSPNGDGANDLFHVMNSNLEMFQLEVYNRWGELVFETQNPTSGWDGIFKGEPQEIGVYVWQSRYRFSGSNQMKNASGNVTLIR